LDRALIPGSEDLDPWWPSRDVRRIDLGVALERPGANGVCLSRGAKLTPGASFGQDYQNDRSVPGSILLTRKLRKKKPK
jgi:hypothetical protein